MLQCTAIIHYHVFFGSLQIWSLFHIYNVFSTNSFGYCIKILVNGVNSIGLKRRGFTADQIHRMQDIYRHLFVLGKNYNSAVETIRDSVASSAEKDRILDFLEASERGVLKGFSTRK